MITYITLCFLIFFIMVVAYIIFKNDILSPTVISCASYLIGVILAILGFCSWNNIEKLSDKLILIFVLGLLFFLVGEILARNFKFKKIFNRNEKEYLNKNYLWNGAIKVEHWKIIGAIILIIIFIVLSIINIRGVCRLYGSNASSLSEMLSVYRKNTDLFSDDVLVYNKLLKFIIGKLQIVVDLIYVVGVTLFFNNKIENKKYSQKGVLVMVLLCLTSTLLTSGRSRLMRYIIIAFVSYFLIMFKKEKSTKRKINSKFLKIGIISIIIIVPIFYNLLSIVGRTTEYDVTAYTSFYFGCPIPSFEVYLEQDYPKSEKFGNESLYGVQQVLHKIGVIDYNNMISREFITIGMRSNVYTGFRRYYADFGIFGVCICQLVFGFVFTKLYMLANNQKNYKYLIFYSYYFYMLVDQVRDDLFWTRFISLNMIWSLLFLNILFFIIFKVSWGKKRC